MALPGSGATAWATQPSLAPISPFPLPEPIVLTYKDTFRFGRASTVVARTAGNPEIINRSGFRVIDFEVHLRNVHDIVIVDRIE